MPDGIWNSGVRNYGATFTHTFNSVGTFPYYCTQGSGGYFPEVGQVIVISATPTPTPPPVTGPPVAITNPATLIASFSATLHGSVEPAMDWPPACIFNMEQRPATDSLLPPKVALGTRP